MKKRVNNVIKYVIYGITWICIYLCVILCSKTLFTYETELPNANDAYRLSSGEVVSQKIEQLRGKLNSVSILIGTYGRVNEGDLYVNLYEDDELICSWVKNVSVMADNEFLVLETNKPIALNMNKEYSITICEEYSGDENAIAVWSINGYGDLSSSQYGENISRTLCVKYEMNDYAKMQYVYGICGIICLVFALVMGFLINVSGIEYYKFAIAVFAVGVICTCFSNDLFVKIKKEVVISRDPRLDFWEAIDAGQEKEYEIYSAVGVMDTVELFSPDMLGEGSLYISIYDNDENLFYEDYLSGTQLSIENTNTVIRINLFESIKEKEVIVKIKNCDEIEHSLYICLAERNRLDTRIIKHTYLGVYIAAVIVLMMAIYLLIVLILCQRKPMSFPKFFVISAACLGLIYLILFPHWSVPDAGAHYSQAYRWANRFVGESAEEQWKSNNEDWNYYVDYWVNDSNPTMRGYADIIYDMHLSCEATQVMESPIISNHLNYYSIFNYLPQALGLTIGRLFNLSISVSLYIARICVLAVYIAGCWFAIKRTPIGKSILTLFVLNPVSIMVGCSFSYDAIVIVIVANFFAGIFALYHDGKRKGNIINAAIWAFLLGAVKGGGYMLLLPMVFIIINKDNIKRSLLNFFIVISSGGFSLLLFDVLLKRGETLYQLGTENSGYLSASYAFSNPISYLSMLVNTYVDSYDVLLFSMLGTDMGWLERVVPYSLVVVLLVVLCFASIFEKDKVKLNKNSKLILLIVVLISMLLIPTSLLSWTPEGSTVIMGLQGRYFLPLLPPVLLLITKFTLHDNDESDRINTIKESVANKCILCFAMVSCIIVYYLLRVYLCR